jgi:hypothetical protein
MDRRRGGGTEGRREEETVGSRRVCAVRGSRGGRDNVCRILEREWERIMSEGGLAEGGRDAPAGEALRR